MVVCDPKERQQLAIKSLFLKYQTMNNFLHWRITRLPVGKQLIRALTKAPTATYVLCAWSNISLFPPYLIKINIISHCMYMYLNPSITMCLPMPSSSLALL